MLDLTTKSLPDTITVEGRDYRLNTDFRVWLKYIREIKNAIQNNSEYIDVTYLFAEDMPSYIDIEKLNEWATPKSELPRASGKPMDATIIDYDLDSELIYSSFMQQYGIDITVVDMHWYKFMALIKGLSADTKLGRVMGYRAYTKSDTSHEEFMREQQRIWEIYPPLTAEQQADIDELNSLFD